MFQQLELTAFDQNYCYYYMVNYKISHLLEINFYRLPARANLLLEISELKLNRTQLH